MPAFHYDARAEARLTTIAVRPGITTKGALFKAFAPILPGWFGDNFDALNDVLAERGETLRIIHADVPLDGDAQRIYLEILTEVGCHVVFPSACAPVIAEALA